MKKIISVLISLLSVQVISSVDTPHRFLVYGDSEVMISNFSYLPKDILNKIEEIKKSKKYKKYDFTKYLSEILKSYKLDSYKGVARSGVKKFNFSSATLVHSLDKEDCHNYPDTYLSLKSNDFKKMINGKEHVGYPTEPFVVVPSNARKIKDDKILNILSEQIKIVYKPSPMDGKPEYYLIKRNIYALIAKFDMGIVYDVFDCSRGCKKLNYRLEYPACGS